MAATCAELHDYVRQHPRPLDAFAHAWVDMTRAIRAFAARHPRNALLLRYEDLVANPSGTFADAFRFVGESFNPTVLEDATRGTGDVGLGDWKTYARSDDWPRERRPLEIAVALDDRPARRHRQ